MHNTSDPNERAHFWIANYAPLEENPEHVCTQHELLDTPTAERMYIDSGEVMRVRVETDEFYDDEPGPPRASEGVMGAKAERRRPPYSITVRLFILFSHLWTFPFLFINPSITPSELT